MSLSLQTDDIAMRTAVPGGWVGRVGWVRTPRLPTLAGCGARRKETPLAAVDCEIETEAE